MRKIIVTGASRGIGHQIAQQLLDRGDEVIGIARHFEQGFEHPNLTLITLDLTDTTDLESTLKELIKSNPDIDTLINNAGAGHFGSLEQFSIAQIKSALDINLIASIMMTRLLIPILKKQDRSDIVFIGSESALEGGRFGSIYSAAKFGLRGFAQSLRHECANNNCHVGIVNPGMVRTDFFDSLNFEPGDAEENALHAEDVAKAVLSFLDVGDHALIEEINLNPRKRVAKKK